MCNYSLQNGKKKRNFINNSVHKLNYTALVKLSWSQFCLDKFCFLLFPFCSDCTVIFLYFSSAKKVHAGHQRNMYQLSSACSGQPTVFVPFSIRASQKRSPNVSPLHTCLTVCSAELALVNGVCEGNTRLPVTEAR